MSGDRSKRPSESQVITRRQLLQRFGMIGGSSMVMGAMNAWDLMAAPAGPRPRLRATRADATVVVLGAGVSGLVTAYELGKLGYDCRILEARDRVGGLNWTVKRGAEHTELGSGGERQVCQFDEGQYINAGPWRIPHEHHGLLGYCRELGVSVEEFNDANEVMYSEDPSLGGLAGKKVYLRQLQADLWGNTAELLAKAANQGALDSALTVEDRERLVQFLIRAGYLNDADQLYVADPRIRGSEGAYDFSLLLQSPFASQVRSIITGTGGPAPVFQPAGGMMQIPLAFERALGDRITRRAEVESILQTEDNARVVYRDTTTGARQEVTADYVVCCLPMSILKTLEVNFSPEMATAVNETNHAAQAKMGLQMKRRFWEQDDGIYGGHLVYMAYSPENAQPSQGRGRAGNPIPQFSYPSNGYISQKGVLLGYYGNANAPGLDGRPLLESPVAARIEHVLTHASKVHPQIREEFENAYAVWWDRVEYSRGAWASNPGPRLEQLSKADGRLYIGSAAASPDPAWMEGAVESAWRTVEAIHARVEQSA
jgi:monoamine oxidase